MPPEIEAGQDTPVVDNEVQNPAATPETREGEQVETPSTDAAGEKDEKTAVPKTYSEEELQDRIERATAKAAAKAERRAFREAAARLESQQRHIPQTQPVDDKPRREQFTDDEEYLDKLTDWKLLQRDKEAQQARAAENQRSLATKTEKLYQEAEKIQGFDRDDFEQLKLTPVIAQVLIESEAAPKLMAYMTSNPEEVERISTLSPAKQAVELGKLEAKLTSAPAVKTTKAPAPITPIGSTGKTSNDISKMSMEDYAAARAKQKPVWLR